MSNTEPITTKEALLRDWQGKLLDVQRFLDAHPQFAVGLAHLTIGPGKSTLSIFDLTEECAKELSTVGGNWTITRDDGTTFDLYCGDFAVILRLSFINRATLNEVKLPRPYKP